MNGDIDNRGGYKQSGWGREIGEAVLDSYLNTNTATLRL
jgi:acyl-CoA reductase-like NAD-dependent aldehyde dehydrogenase